VLDARTGEAKALAHEAEALRAALAHARAVAESLEKSLATQRTSHVTQTTEAVARVQHGPPAPASPSPPPTPENSRKRPNAGRRLASQAEQERETAKGQAAHAAARLQHLIAERTAFIAEVERRLGVRQQRATP
jgi:hypothetical protein